MFIDKVAWILIKEGKVLSTLSKGKDVFYFPGGKREKGESDEDCLTREINEELGVSLIPSSMEYFGTFEAQSHGHEKGILIKMICYFAKYKGNLEPKNEIDSFHWLNYSDKLKSSPVDQVIFNVLQSKGYLKN